jgi:broad specificity phosphatase PhoE
MKTRIFLVRHAQSVAQERGIVQGRGIDVPLSEEGVRQAARAAELLKGEKFDAIYASNAIRSIDTATPIRAFHPDVPYVELPELVERSKGIAEGLSRDEFRSRWPDIQAQWDQEQDARPPEGENFEDVHGRVVPLIEHHVKEHGPDKTLLYVIHGNVNRAVLGHMLGVPFNRQSRIEQGYCAINIATFNHATGRWHVECVNRSPQ